MCLEQVVPRLISNISKLNWYFFCQIWRANTHESTRTISSAPPKFHIVFVYNYYQQNPWWLVESSLYSVFLLVKSFLNLRPHCRNFGWVKTFPSQQYYTRTFQKRLNISTELHRPLFSKRKYVWFGRLINFRRGLALYFPAQKRKYMQKESAKLKFSIYQTDFVPFQYGVQQSFSIIRWFLQLLKTRNSL